MSETEKPWSQAAEVVRLFPTFVWKSRLRPEVYEPINATIMARIAALRQGLPGLQAGQAWQSGHGLHKLDELRHLVSCVRSAADAVLVFLRISDASCRITGCWANVNAPGACHRMHTHPNNFLSGAYYVQVEEGADTINFHDPRPQTGIVRPPVTELTPYNTDQVVVRVSTGTLIVFPAWLPHSVDANESAKERISVSFNVMFAAFAETMGHPLWGED
jgi:uncharacterized protein (TIGR02466 family)